jgi:hypothetical protein
MDEEILKALSAYTYFVEADSFVIHALYLQNTKKMYHYDPPCKEEDWEADSRGFWTSLPNNRLVCVTFRFADICRKRVCFYYPTSNMVDWNAIDDFMCQFWGLPKRKCNAENFHQCLIHVKKVYPQNKT